MLCNWQQCHTIYMCFKEMIILSHTLVLYYTWLLVEKNATCTLFVYWILKFIDILILYKLHSGIRIFAYIIMSYPEAKVKIRSPPDSSKEIWFLDFNERVGNQTNSCSGVLIAVDLPNVVWFIIMQTHYQELFCSSFF